MLRDLASEVLLSARLLAALCLRRREERIDDLKEVVESRECCEYAELSLDCEVPMLLVDEALESQWP